MYRKMEKYFPFIRMHGCKGCGTFELHSFRICDPEWQICDTSNFISAYHSNEVTVCHSSCLERRK